MAEPDSFCDKSDRRGGPTTTGCGVLPYRRTQGARVRWKQDFGRTRGRTDDCLDGDKQYRGGVGKQWRENGSIHGERYSPGDTAFNE